MKKERVIGGAKSTGVILKKDDFDQLTEVIAKAKAKDKLLAKMQIGTFGASGIGTAPTLGTISIQRFVRQLAQLYALPLDHGEFYGVNKYGEFVQWVQPHELGQKRNN